jgi:hypothetical protein
MPQASLFTTHPSRRKFLRDCGMGMGTLALGGFLGTQAHATGAGHAMPHFRPRAKRVIHLFMNGGPSQVDTFDPKPILDQYHGKALPLDNLKTERRTGAALRSPFAFKNHGQSGIPISELFSKTAACADDLCVIRSMYADVPNHEPSLMLMNCGHGQLSRPSLGSWVTYGLGSENDNLPAYVVLCPNGKPIKEALNWQSGFLPGSYQGTYIDTKHREVDKLIENLRNPTLSSSVQDRQLAFLRRMNQIHLDESGHDPALEARIRSFELASRMQLEASDAFDIDKEPEHIRQLYGDNPFSRQALMARRLAERGVRFIQLWFGAGQPWDSHDNIEDHRGLAQQCDQGIAALLTDLKQRGMLDDTLVIWGGEFGRTPVVELPMPGGNNGSQKGRDHNHYGFTMWMAGGGVKGGHIHGATDEFGFKAIENPVHIHDLHATILHTLGFNHETFTFPYSGREFRLTDVHGNVIHSLLA